MDEAVLFLLCFVIGVKCQLAVENGGRSIDVYLVQRVELRTEGHRVNQSSCSCSALGLLPPLNSQGLPGNGQG